MGVANSNTHVANATGKPLRIYYEVSKMELAELVMEVGIGGGIEGSKSKEGGSASGKFNTNTNTKLVFKPDSRVRYIRLPINDTCDFAGDGELFASVFVEDEEVKDYQKKTIALNFHVPSDRSFIVTANHNIKFQNYGNDLWIDDSGYNHCPK